MDSRADSNGIGKTSVGSLHITRSGGPQKEKQGHDSTQVEERTRVVYGRPSLSLAMSGV